LDFGETPIVDGCVRCGGGFAASSRTEQDQGQSAVRIGVAIATAGRPHIVRKTVAELRKQTRPVDTIYVCAPEQTDVADLKSASPVVCVKLGLRGSCAQRNAIIEQATNEDIIVFFDDDFLPHRNYMANLESIFICQPEIVMVTGTVIVDGIIGPGLDFEEAQRILSMDQFTIKAPIIEEVYNGYGCNMAVRAKTIRDHRTLFDEALPLYGWLEDIDFSRRLARYGRVVKASDVRGVHLGHKKGRQAGLLLGYSQVANPIYLARKGTMSWRRAMSQLARNVAANCWRAILPETYIDRRGRLLGHGFAIADLLSGKLDPRRVLEL
jgi:GT2 family glycosyltransferase